MLHYNAKFRRHFWSELGKLQLNERREIFTAGSPNHHLTKVMVHSVRTIDELNMVNGLLPDWGYLQLHLEYARRQIEWDNGPGAERIWKYFHRHDEQLTQ